MSSSTLVKTLLHNSVADSVYKEITSKTGRYYYFLGSILEWSDPLDPPSPVDSFEYERETRGDIILVKEIQPADVAYVIDRYDWSSNSIYDMYDDLYCEQVIGVDLISGGGNYTANTTVSFTGGNGTGAAANAVIANGIITAIVVDNRGSGYNTKPNVVITDTVGSGATANAVVNFAYSGAKNLQSSKFYVITDDFNVYKCLDNNNNSKSSTKPTEVSPEPFTTTDGYKWKFMGNVPIALRNKFLSITQVPINTSLTSQFYSDGELKDIRVINTGNNYTYASIVVQGDGYLEEDPYLIINSNVVNSGSGYTSATASIDPPVSPSTPWVSSTFFNTGKIISFNSNYYEVVQGGISDTYGPVHTRGTVKNGNVILKFRGTGITANVLVSSSNVIGLANINGAVRDIVITNHGSGYISTPSITISGTGSNAAAVATLLNNTVSRIIITNQGRDFTTAPNVEIGTSWTANANLSINTQVYYNTRLYTVSTAGYANTTPPSHSTGTQTLGNAAFTFAGTRATGYARIKYGAGYTKAPNIVISGDGTGANVRIEAEKTEALIYPYIENGKITRVIIENGGIGYTSATLTAVGDGTNAEFEINLSPGDIDSLQSTTELLAVPGAIHAIKIISEGYSYTGANVAIVGDGTGATANATITNGKITRINVLTEGSGYTHANVVITAIGTGNGASARAILPPYGGHGRNIVKELFAKSLAFYTTIGAEKNQGFVVTNDYRQFGIIKDIRNYDNDRYFNNSVGSGCWLISGNLNSNLFTEDTVITRSSDGLKFLVVSSTNSGILAIPVRHGTPSSGDIFSEPTGNSFTATGVTEPDVDKYSGDLLYIDNRPAFNTTEDQSVSIKSVFTY